MKSLVECNLESLIGEEDMVEWVEEHRVAHEDITNDLCTELEDFYSVIEEEHVIGYQIKRDDGGCYIVDLDYDTLSGGKKWDRVRLPLHLFRERLFGVYEINPKLWLILPEELKSLE